MEPLTHLDLFSGIGGFALAARWLGIDTVGFCEIDPWCRRVLTKNFPGVPQHDDVRTLTGDALSDLGPIDIITGGYPCQPFSLAGQRRGADDDRHLWPEMRRIVNEVRPRFLLAENVAGHISMGLDVVLSELEADGYTCGAIVVPAGAVNALHRRDRVWIMAHAESDLRRTSGDDRRESSDRTGLGIHPDTNRAGRQEQRRSQPVRPEQPAAQYVGGGASVADADCRRRRESSGVDPQRQSLPAPEWAQGTPGSGSGGGDVVGREEPRKASRPLDAGSDGLSAHLVRRSWADGSWEDGLPRVVTAEHDRRQKLMAAGNAIVPQVAYEILRVMIGDDVA